jgi:protein tyrosine phosphatase (PTP) superfamily phosphohydrolase (DUF442 family)
MLTDIYNFLPLSEKLLSSGMPTGAQLASIAEAGVQIVINLALPTSERALPDEAALVVSLGMKYIPVPVDWDHPTRENLEEFMNNMDAHPERKVFVHCQANYRATGFITLYRILRLGWTPSEAFPDMLRIWNPEEFPVWQKFMEENIREGA